MNYDGRLVAREWLPRSRRIDVNRSIMVECAAGVFEGELLNVSARGFRVRTSGVLEEGWEVALRFAKDAPVKGVIRWVAGNDSGGSFNDPVAL
jgi:hypothetical protein